MSSDALPRSTVLPRIPSLDGLRALSIFLVVALHSLQRYGVTHHVSKPWYVIFNGASGVSIFFEISGFLITSLLLQEHHKRGSISLRGFYLRRIFRILPPLYFYIGMVVVLGLWGRLVLSRIDLLSGLFFFHNIAGGPMWSMEHLWSISVEEQFYLWWPCALVLCLRLPGLRGRYAASLIPIVILVVSPVMRTLSHMHTAGPVLQEIGKMLNLDFLMFGCLVALLQHSSRFEAMYRFATCIWWLPPAVMALCSLLFELFKNAFNLTVGYTINGFAIAMFLLWCTRHSESVVGRILNFKPIVKVGVLSYSIYLWQTLFLQPHNVNMFGPLSLITAFPLSWLCILLAGAFSYYVIEQPSLRLRSRLIKSFHVYAQRREQARANA